jgi:ABC-2 type transport system permease protein
LVLKELIQFSRDRLLLVFAFVAPVLQLILLGNAVSRDLTELPLAVHDQDRSDLSREVVTALDNTEELELTHYPSSLDELYDLIEAGQVTVAVVIPPGLSRDAASGTNVPELQVIVDGTNSFVGSGALRAIQSAIQAKARDLAPASASTMAGGVNLQTRAFYNQALDQRWHSISAQLGFIALQVTVIIAVIGLVREREVGTLEQIAITPLRRLELIGGKAVVPLAVGMFNYVLMFIVTQIVFDLPMRGSVPLLFGFTLIYLITECGYALMLSTLSRTQQQAITLIFVWVMVAMTLSGYLVPVTRMPWPLQVLSVVFPLRHYLVILRGVMLKGAGLAALWPSVLALVALSAVVVTATAWMLGRVDE